MRLMILESLFNLANRHLQAASWTNPNNANQSYTLVEFVNESLLHDTDYLAYHKETGVINEAEYVILLRLVKALATYSPPNGDWYNHDEVLIDPNWHAVTDTADSVLSELLALSFNSPQWLGR